MVRTTLAVLLGTILDVGCGHEDDSCNQEADGPPPGPQVILRATQDSFVTLSNGSTEMLNGSILVSLCFSQNTYFAGRVETVNLHSASITVASGCQATGRMLGSTLYDDMRLEFAATVSLNGEASGMGGSAPYKDGATFPAYLGLVAGDYSFRLVVDLDRLINSERREPYCADWGFV